MNDGIDASAALPLWDLHHAYASALDRLDAAALREVFHPDATLRVFAPDAVEPRSRTHGHDQLVGMIGALRARYARTMHVVTNATASMLGPDTATGRAYGVSHHLLRGPGRPCTLVVHLVYEDGFRRGPDGGWCIGQRDIRFLWAEEHPVLPWDEAAARGGFG